MKPVEILSSGMVTGVGLDSLSSCAAIRCAIDNFSETRFMDKGGEWIIGSQVPLENNPRGTTRLAHLVAPAIAECLAQAGRSGAHEIPLLLCVAEPARPGRLADLDARLPEEIHAILGMRFHSASRVIAEGRIATATALEQASALIHERRLPFCIIAGADSFLHADTLMSYERRSRLLTSKNSNGFVPGEAGAAVLVGPPGHFAGLGLKCLGIGRGFEKAAVDSEEPLRADGLVQAFRAAFAAASCGFEDVDYRLTDANGEQYGFKEAALAMTRTMRVRKAEFDIWHPADCVGETGAAMPLCCFGVALAAARKSYHPGPGVLCHFGNDSGERAALVLTSERAR